MNIFDGMSVADGNGRTQMLIRCFDQTLARWRSAHDFADPAQRAAYELGIETWRWLVLIDPWAEPRLCIAAVIGESAHAGRIIEELGLPDPDRQHIIGLIAPTTRPALQEDRSLLARARVRAAEVIGRRSPRLAKVSGTWVNRSAENDRRRDGTG